MPSCVTAGQYLMKVEIIALHGAFQEGAAQFYTECAQVQVTGSGTSNPATVSFPGAYSANDPGILVGIYDSAGQPTNSGQPYTIPGPPVLDCSAVAPVPAPVPTTMATSTIPRPTEQAQAPPHSSPAAGPKSGAGSLEQCGGEGWTGPTACTKGTCTVANQWFSQCL